MDEGEGSGGVNPATAQGLAGSRGLPPAGTRDPAEEGTPGPFLSVPQLQLIYDSAPIGLAFLTPDCRYLQINQYMTEICGISVADHIGRSVRETVPNISDAVERIVQSILRNGEPIMGIEVGSQRVDKAEADRFWLTNWHPLKSADGRILGINVAAEEITERKRAEAQSEKALRASEERWRSVFESSTLGIAMLDHNLRFLATNAAFQAMVGYGEEALRSRSPLDIITEEERGAARVRLIELREGKRQHYEAMTKYLRRDGSIVTVNTYVSTVPGNESSPPIFLATAIDVTARVQAEAKVRESEELFRAMAHSAPVMVRTSDSQMGCNFVNEVWLEFTGRTLGEELGNGWLEGVLAEDRQRLFDTFVSSFKAHRPFVMEYRLRHSDGEYRWILDSGVPRYSPDGRFVGYISSGIDITDRKKMESELKRREAYLSEAEKISHTGCWARNPTTGELFWSQEEWRIFGLDPAKTELSYPLFLQLVHPEDRASLEERSIRAVQDKKSYDIPFRVVLPDGSLKHIHSVGHPFFDESGDLVEYIGVSMDVTERKRAEAALQEAQSELSRVARLTTMGELAASIAHEINQPLSAVVTFAHSSLRWLARDPPNLAEVGQAVKRIVTEANRASEVINRIRALLKSDKPAYVELDINDAIQEVLTVANGMLENRAVAVRTFLSRGLPPVLGDRVQLQQVILNLIINGADAMKPIAKRQKMLRVGSRIDASRCVLVAVEDSGTGLDPAIADRIFDPLFTTKPDGMGMGLSICRSIVEAHGGRIWASSGSPIGAVFQFTLPTSEKAD